MAVLGEIPSTGYNPARVMLDPSDPDYLKKLGIVGAVEGQHELNAPATAPAMMPNADGTVTPDATKQSPTPSAPEAAPPSMTGLPTMSQHEMQYQDTMNKKPAIQNLWDKTNDIQSKPARVLGKIGVGALGGLEAVGESMFPTVASKIPGSVTNVAGQKEQAFTRNQQEQAAELDKEKLAATESEKEAEIQSKTELAKLNDGIRLQVADLNTATKSGDVDKMIQARKDLADITNKWHTAQLGQQYLEFKTTDAFRKWKDENDNDVKKQIATMTANKAPAAMMQTAEFAKGGLQTLGDMQNAMKKLEDSGVMGSLPANWIENYIFEHNAVDPTLPPDVRETIGKLQMASDLTASAMQRAHTGRGMKEMYDSLKQKLGPGQDWNALRGAMDESGSMMGTYAKSATNENIAKLRGVSDDKNPAKKTEAGASKGIVSKDMLQQYATRHKITPEAASQFLTNQGYTVGK